VSKGKERSEWVEKEWMEGVKWGNECGKGTGKGGRAGAIMHKI